MKQIYSYLKFFVYIFIVYLLFSRIQIDNFIVSAKNLNLNYFSLCIIIFSTIFFIQNIYNYKLYTNVSELKISFREFLKLFYKSTIINLLIPFFGTAYKAFILKKMGLNYNKFLSVLAITIILYLFFFTLILVSFILLFEFNIYYFIIYLIILMFFFIIISKYLAYLIYFFKLSKFLIFSKSFYKTLIIYFSLQFFLDFLVIFLAIYSLGYNYSIEQTYYIFSSNYLLDRTGFYNYPGFGEYFMGIFFQFMGFTFLGGAILKFTLRIGILLSLPLSFIILVIYLLIFKSNETKF